MKKILILLAFFGMLGLASPARAQYYGYGTSGGFYPYAWGWNYSTAAFAVDQFFSTVQNTWSVVQRDQAIENEIQTRRYNLENYKSVKRYYTEGIPPFAPVAPDGKPRSPKITWEDVESIR